MYILLINSSHNILDYLLFCPICNDLRSIENVAYDVTDNLSNVLSSNMKQSKKNVVLSLASMISSIKVNVKTVTINPLTIFQRTVIAKKNDEDVGDLLTYVQTPLPMAQ
ncbi:unnamed protein product [Parnassius mnemosyne]|uniref:Uncharacterized protein n=1 Tax=Parnassius mnemosyne TaxID=213953 RepID=A0AAV1LGY4_9NEOP